MADRPTMARERVALTSDSAGAEFPLIEIGAEGLAEEFATLTRSLLNAHTVAEALEHIVTAAHQVIDGVDLVSVTLRAPNGRFHTPIETGPVAIKLDQIQYDTGEGPCVDAARRSNPGFVHSEDLASEPAWPRFGPAAADHGFVSILATTLLPDSRPPQLSGALNLYSRSAGTFDHQACDAALLLATHASLALAGVLAVENAELREAQLNLALESRDVIGQAKGILMHRRGISADEAFGVLRRASQDLNIKLAALAQTVVLRHTELD